ncbi:MAG: hypothetical protein ACC655_08115 [Rhodothermia bacterium]
MRRILPVSIFAFVLTAASSLASDPFTVKIISAPKHLILGEPIRLQVAVENKSGVTIPVSFNRPPLAVDVEWPDGKVAVVCGLCRGRFGVVRKELPPRWKHSEKLETVWLDEPGRYTIRVRLKRHWNIEQKPAEYPDIWWGEVVSSPTTIWLDEPEGVDREAFEAFNGEPVPRPGSKAERTELIDRFPTSTYAGYALAKQISPLPGVGDDPADKIRQLTYPGFFQRFPTTRDRRKEAAEGARLGMEEEVRRAAKLRREFLDLHPDFPLRTKIEKQLGDLELILGNYERAYAAWTWVADHATQNVEWAKGMVQVMESQKLVAVAHE